MTLRVQMMWMMVGSRARSSGLMCQKDLGSLRGQMAKIFSYILDPYEGEDTAV